MNKDLKATLILLLIIMVIAGVIYLFVLSPVLMGFAIISAAILSMLWIAWKGIITKIELDDLNKDLNDRITKLNK